MTKSDIINNYYSAIKAYNNSINGRLSQAKPTYSQQLPFDIKDVEELYDKIENLGKKGYKRLKAYRSCDDFLNKKSMDITVLTQLYLDAKATVDTIEQEIEKAVNSIMQLSKDDIIEIIKTKYLPHIQDIVLASEIESQNNYEMSSALKALATEITVKNILLLTNPKSLFEKKVIEEMTSINLNEQSSIQMIKAKNSNNEFFNSIFNVDSTQNEEERKLNIWSTIKILLYEIKSIDEIKKVFNATLSQNSKITGHEINELFMILPPLYKDIISYKMITNIPKSKSLLRKIKTLTPDDYVTEIDVLLMNLGFESVDEVSHQQKLLAENTKAFVDFRYIEKLSNEAVDNLLSSLALSSYMILNYAINNPEISKVGNNSFEYSYFKDIFTEEEFNSLKEKSKKQNVDEKTIIFYFAFIKNYIGSRKININDKKLKNINNLFETIRNCNNITNLGQMFNDWYQNINIEELSIEELNELTIFSPEFVYDHFSFEDKLIYQKCKQTNIRFEYYYKLNVDLFNELLTLYQDKFTNESIPEYYFRYSLEEIKYAYRLKINQTNNYNYQELLRDYENKRIDYIPEYSENILTKQELDSAKQSIITTSMYDLHEEDTLEEKDVFVRNIMSEEAKNSRKTLDRASRLLNILKEMENDPSKENLLSYSQDDIKDALIIFQLSKLQRINIENYVHLSSEQLDEMIVKESQSGTYDLYGYKDQHDASISQQQEYLIQRNERVEEEYKKLRNVEPNANMKFLGPIQVVRNLQIFYSINQNFTSSPSFYYKTPEEVIKIVEKYKSLRLEEQLPEEILYFTVDEINDECESIIQLIQNEKDASENDEFEIESIDKIRRIIQKRTQRKEERRRQEELNSLFDSDKSSSSETVVVINPAIAKVASYK